MEEQEKKDAGVGGLLSGLIALALLGYGLYVLVTNL